MKILKAIAVVSLCSLPLAGCASAPGPIASAEAKKVLENVKTPDTIKEFEIVPAEGGDSEESTDYYESYDASSICNSVAELGQLTYQAGYELKNKQALPPELRSFAVRQGIKFEPTEDAESEYVNFHVALLSFDEASTAASFASELKEAVEPCGDVSGEYQSRATLKFSSLDGPNDFSHKVRETWSMFDSEFVTDATDYLVQKGARVALVHVGASEDGLEYYGISTDTVDQTAKDIIKQILP